MSTEVSDTPEVLETEVEPENKKGSVPITEEDEQRLDAAISKTVDRDAEARVKNVLSPQGIRRIIGDQREHLRSVEDALLIADRWSPRNKNKDKIIDKESGKTISLPQGNLGSIEDLEQDAVYLASLNAKISTLWALSKGALNRSEAQLANLKAEAKKAVGEARKGFLKSKIKSEAYGEQLAKTSKAVREAEELFLDVTEQAEILGSCYFSTKDLTQVLLDRAKSLRGEYRTAVRTGA